MDASSSSGVTHQDASSGLNRRQKKLVLETLAILRDAFREIKRDINKFDKIVSTKSKAELFKDVLETFQLRENPMDDTNIIYKFYMFLESCAQWKILIDDQYILDGRNLFPRDEDEDEDTEMTGSDS
jgi:hypothetical protein